MTADHNTSDKKNSNVLCIQIVLPSSFSHKIKNRLISAHRGSVVIHVLVRLVLGEKIALCHIVLEKKNLNRILLDFFYPNRKQSKSSLVNY